MRQSKHSASVRERCRSNVKRCTEGFCHWSRRQVLDCSGIGGQRADCSGGGMREDGTALGPSSGTLYTVWLTCPEVEEQAESRESQ